MHTKFTTLTPELYEYLVAHGSPRPPVLEALTDATAALGGVSRMQIAAEQGALLTLLTRAIGARRALEVGTFTGYSALCLARGLPADGRLIACDVSREWTDVARRYWTEAGVADRIDLRIGPALETLQGLGPEAIFDIAFIDADKSGYRDYYEEILARLRPNGLILLDNVLWSGKVAQTDAQDETTVALRAINAFVAGDERVEAVMLPVSDGLTIARKR